jgi:ABC-2 type transport system ATP-binding protein
LTRRGYLVYCVYSICSLRKTRGQNERNKETELNNVLTIEHLRKEYKEFVLEDVSLELPPGMVLGLIGPNGAGKTTTIKCLLNLIHPDGGRINVLNYNPLTQSREIKDRVGYVGEEQYFYAQRTPAWTGLFVSHFFSRWDSGLYQKLLARFDIPPRKRISKLSRGTKVKLTLAIALAHHPELIVLDEPTSGLDPIVRREILDLLRETVREDGKSVLISSHITDDIEQIADLVAYIIDGRITLTASKDDLLASWKKVQFIRDALDPAIAAQLLHREDHMFGSSGITKNYQELAGALAAGIEREDIKIENVGLDDILIELTRET